ncbi:uncharacterized protein LOC136090198 [Hydra vulgaris]|uniref:Uncharacterized protein LOC136090198 n=1 Tax=Hydra vulgaris TaxID=6087 RepID=A0ABM4DDI7_HYDVU
MIQVFTLVIVLFIATYERALEKEKVASYESDLNLTENVKKSIANESRLRKRKVDYSGLVESEHESDDGINFKIGASVQEKTKKRKLLRTEPITTTPDVPEFPNLREEQINIFTKTMVSPVRLSQRQISDSNLKGNLIYGNIFYT